MNKTLMKTPAGKRFSQAAICLFAFGLTHSVWAEDAPVSLTAEAELPRLPPKAESSPILNVRSDGARNEAVGLKIGDSAKSVQEKLGKPKGVFSSGADTVWMYERGTVTLKDDRVTGLRIMTEQEFKNKEAQRMAIRREREEEIAIKEAEGISEGQKVLDRVLADEKFAARPANTRVAYWRNFMRQFPGIDVTEHLEAAKDEAREQETLRQQIADELKKNADNSKNEPAYKRNGRLITR